MVQETYAHWYAMSRDEQAAIASPGAWLTKVAGRLCLNVLSSARARRETYVGEWIPEPVPDSSEWRPADPADRVTLDESVSMAFLVVLDSMTPAERVAFILHDVFRYPFAEIVGRTPAACRQLASSARRRVRDAQAPATPVSRQAQVVRDFKRAWEARDIEALLGVLAPDATATSDGGGLGQHGAPPGRGRRTDPERAEPPRTPVPRAHAPGAHRQRPAGPDRAGGRCHRFDVRVRDRRREDPAHLGGAQPGEAACVERRCDRPAAAVTAPAHPPTTPPPDAPTP